MLRSLSEFGYGAVEPYDVVTDPERLRDELAETGLTACSVHARVLGEDAHAALAGTRTVSAGTVIVPSVKPERFANAGSINALAQELNEGAARAADYGLRFGYHNHWFELESVIDGKTGLEILADGLNGNVILEVDTYWAAVGGQDVPEGSSPASVTASATCT